MPKLKRKKQSKPGKRPTENLLESAVGKDVYRIWVRMLKKIGPQGRTHRLAVVVAAMLQYASFQGKGGAQLATVLLEGEEDEEYGDISPAALRVVQSLFKDAGVKWKRRSSRGQEYSVAEEAAREYVKWDDYPWE